MILPPSVDFLLLPENVSRPSEGNPTSMKAYREPLQRPRPIKQRTTPQFSGTQACKFGSKLPRNLVALMAYWASIGYMTVFEVRGMGSPSRFISLRSVRLAIVKAGVHRGDGGRGAAAKACFMVMFILCCRFSWLRAWCIYHEPSCCTMTSNVLAPSPESSAPVYGTHGSKFGGGPSIGILVMLS